MRVPVIGWLVLGGGALLLLSMPSRRAPSSGALFLPPPYPDPSSLPPVSDDNELMRNPPTLPGPDEMIWERYARDEARPGPALSQAEIESKTPISRGLTAFERWALTPFFPVPQDLGHTLHNGERPPFPDNVEIDPNLWGVTMQRPGVDPGVLLEPEIWFPHAPRPLWQLWWISLLAHELTHAAQVRIGMTIQQAAESMLKWGYVDSPIERQARWMQRLVHDRLLARARTFYRVA